MLLNTGDIFEGVYQLEEKVWGGEYGQPSRWLADEITAYRRREVIIDTIPAEYVPDLHWKADIPGMKLAGQSPVGKCRYIVWEKDQAPPPIAKYEPGELNEPLRKHLASQIDSLPVAAHETLHTQSMPEYWYCGNQGTLIYYRKVARSQLAHPTEQEVKADWKRAILATGTAQSEDQPNEVAANPSPWHWPVLLTLVGLLLAAGVYTLRSQPRTDTDDAQVSSRLGVFTQALERGVDYAEKAAYPEAIQSFERAVREAPVSEAIDARLDSLARAYSAYAEVECARYRTTGSHSLYFIPNQYYHYAAILSRNPVIHTCE